MRGVYMGVIFLLCTLTVFSDSIGKKPLKTIDELKEVSGLLKRAQEQAKRSTICIDLGDGASGSGVIISEDGLVLSAAHVTQELGKELTAIMEDGTKFKMVGLGLDSSSDASFAKISLPEGSAPLPYVSMSSDIALGQYVFSLGHSGGFDIKRGSVLRLGRILSLDNTSLRTDCTLIGGDSGGPLFNLEGELIGIHSRVGTVTNSNTHVPINVFQDQWEELINGAVKGDGTFADAGIPFLGMHLMSRENQLHVTDVALNSRAHKLAILEGDILTALNGEEIRTGSELLSILKNLEITATGVEIDLSFLRGDESREVNFLFND